MPVGTCASLIGPVMTAALLDEPSELPQPSVTSGALPPWLSVQPMLFACRLLLGCQAGRDQRCTPVIGLLVISGPLSCLVCV